MPDRDSGSQGRKTKRVAVGVGFSLALTPSRCFVFGSDQSGVPRENGHVSELMQAFSLTTASGVILAWQLSAAGASATWVVLRFR